MDIYHHHQALFLDCVKEKSNEYIGMLLKPASSIHETVIFDNMSIKSLLKVSDCCAINCMLLTPPKSVLID